MTPRFESLQASLHERQKLLEAAVDLCEFYHYHDMELNWINELDYFRPFNIITFSKA